MLPSKGVQYHAAFIDGLRAVAVLSVIIYHLNPTLLPGGFVGVDIFFVISGFVVSYSISEFAPLGTWRSLTRFYARRFARIMPALLVCLLITLLLSALFIPDAYLSHANYETGLRAFVGLSNVKLAQISGDYFSPISSFNPFTHTWSLGVEEQFYLFFPILFLVWQKSH
jgi:peptidoglycan/LPS O-acetylase OafA/YrhL